MGATSLVIGIALEADGSVIEDACWLRPSNNVHHIILADLDAVLKKVNLAFSGRR